MALFQLGKKKEEEKQPCPCCCGENKKTTSASEQPGEGIRCVKVLGLGCKFCHEQYENTKAAVASLELGLEVEYITDMEKIVSYGAMRMPVLVVNEQVASMGKVLKPAEVEAILRRFQG